MTEAARRDAVLLAEEIFCRLLSLRKICPLSECLRDTAPPCGLDAAMLGLHVMEVFLATVITVLLFRALGERKDKGTENAITFSSSQTDFFASRFLKVLLFGFGREAEASRGRHGQLKKGERKGKSGDQSCSERFVRTVMTKRRKTSAG